MCLRRVLLAFVTCFITSQAVSANAKHPVPQRVISLAPHLTEHIYSAGAGEKLVGVVAYSDFPEEANTKVSVGSAAALNYEKIVQLQPDLILAWQGGNRPQDIAKLKSLGFNVREFQNNNITDIPSDIRRLGTLLGTSTQAEANASRLSNTIQRVRDTYQHRSNISFFYQVWDRPLITINGNQFISQALNLCGASNVFAALKQIAPTINPESVIQYDPDLIILGGSKQQQKLWLKKWRSMNDLKAAKQRNIVALNSDVYQRPTGRLIEGLDSLCQWVQQAREGR